MTRTKHSARDDRYAPPNQVSLQTIYAQMFASNRSSADSVTLIPSDEVSLQRNPVLKTHMGKLKKFNQQKLANKINFNFFNQQFYNNNYLLL